MHFKYAVFHRRVACPSLPFFLRVARRACRNCNSSDNSFDNSNRKSAINQIKPTFSRIDPTAERKTPNLNACIGLKSTIEIRDS